MIDAAIKGVIKAVIFIIWPVLACFIAAFVMFMLFVAWFAIPLMTLQRKPDGSFSLTR